MDVKCSNCGTDNTQDSEFCKKCGTQMGESEAKPIPTQTLEAAKEELIVCRQMIRTHSLFS